MDRYEKARNYHKRGFNCCQSVLASFTDLMSGLLRRHAWA